MVAHPDAGTQSCITLWATQTSSALRLVGLSLSGLLEIRRKMAANWSATFGCLRASNDPGPWSKFCLSDHSCPFPFVIAASHVLDCLWSFGVFVANMLVQSLCCTDQGVFWRKSPGSNSHLVCYFFRARVIVCTENTLSTRKWRSATSLV